MFSGNIGLVRKLLRLGADPNSQDNAGNKFSNIKKYLFSQNYMFYQDDFVYLEFSCC